jgi:hypothetical protein
MYYLEQMRPYFLSVDYISNFILIWPGGWGGGHKIVEHDGRPVIIYSQEIFIVFFVFLCKFSTNI